MAGCVIIGMLAAYGLLSMLWVILGGMLPSGRGCAIVCMGYPDEGIVARYRWLKGLGLFSGPLIAVAEEDQWQREYRDTEICNPGNLQTRLEWERSQFDGTGNGDSSRHHQCGGVPEL